MTTEIERYEPAGEIDSWVDVLAPVGDLATRIAGTAFVPEALRGSPAAVAAAILTGRELGIGPMTALRHVNVIKGKPGQSAELMRALILREGHALRFIETTDTRCVVEGRRRGEEEWTRVTFTADQAKQARIDLGAYPQDKLVARATSRLARRIFADVVAGMPYVTEDLEDGVTDTATTSPAPPAAAATVRKAQRARQPQRQHTPPAEPAEPENKPSPPVPPLPGEDGYNQPESKLSAENLDLVDEKSSQHEPADGITPAQLQMLHASFTELGMTDRDERLATASAAIGRDLTTSKDLTKQEASDLITALTQQLEGPG